MNGSRARSSRASAAEIFAICISDSAPSIMRAPPEHETMITGRRAARCASSMPRTIFSPTTTPIEPPMKLYSIEAIDGLDAVDAADADDDGVRTGRWRRCVFARRALYGLVSVNLSGSFERRFGASSSQRSSSNSVFRRSVAVIRK